MLLLNVLLGYPHPAFRFIEDLHQWRQVDFAALIEFEVAVQIDVLPGLFRLRRRDASGPSLTSGATISRRRSDAPPKTLTRSLCDQGRGTGF
jgi:hypothetical protein